MGLVHYRPGDPCLKNKKLKPKKPKSCNCEVHGILEPCLFPPPKISFLQKLVRRKPCELHLNGQALSPPNTHVLPRDWREGAHTDPDTLKVARDPQK